MKKSILALAASVFITGSILSSCSTPAEKVENAENKVADANYDLYEANKENQEEIENYKREIAEKTAANDRSIAEYKARIENEKSEAKAEYNAKIARLEQKNGDMKKKMDDYKAHGKEQWQSFKSEFSRDMDELGKAFKDVMVKNN